MSVKLRKRLKGVKISLYLDIYQRGKRAYEYLNLYLTPELEKGRLTKAQKDANRINLELAERIQAKRFLEVMDGTFGFRNREKENGSFMRYVEYLITKHNTSKGNFDNWDSMLKHLKNYVQTDVAFQQINKQWLEGFKDYLETVETSMGKLLSQNSQLAYYSKLCAALKRANKC